MGNMTHPLAAVHSHMPADRRDASPLSTWPEDAEWTTAKHTAGDNGPWCKTDRHAGQKVPAAQSETVTHLGEGFQALHAFWETCQDCHDELADAVAAQEFTPAAEGSDDLVQFLRARLDEDERCARRAQDVDPAPWRADTYPGRPNRDQDHHKGAEFLAGKAGMVIDRDGNDLWDCEGASSLSMTSESAEHAARHDPARVLAEVDAKRQILASYEQVANGDGDEYEEYADGWAHALGLAVRSLALPYAGHLDYRDGWQP
jgi:hypothetical protein